MNEAQAYKKLKKWLLDMDEAMLIAEKLFPQILEADKNGQTINSGFNGCGLAQAAMDSPSNYSENYADIDEVAPSFANMPRELAILLVLVARYESNVGDPYGGGEFGKKEIDL